VAHSAIHEEAKNTPILKEIYQQVIPRTALENIAVVVMNIVDRVYEVPS
jgi:hypothetical protein